MPETNPTHSRPAKAPWWTIYFRLDAPEAQQVSVMGDFNDWNAEKHALCKNANGVWECQMPLPAGRYAYCFVVDGACQPDPQCQQRMHTEAGDVHSIITVSPSTQESGQ